jgi:ribosomal protein S18 acetylase RimI-like enzyme
MDLIIRAIAPADVLSVVGLLREFAAFEELSDFCEVTDQSLNAAMFGKDAVAEGLIALDGDAAIGYAIFYPNFASFRGQRGLYLEDIYVNDQYRGKGVGEAMIREIARIAAARGFERMDFLVLDWNTPALKFYEKLGAIRDDKERHFKFTDDAFRLLSEPPA